MVEAEPIRPGPASPLLESFILTAPELLKLDIPPREMIITPVFRVQDIMMVYSFRGVGKTWWCLEVAIRIARGEQVFGYEVLKPRRGMIFDGEMALADLQERINDLTGGNPPDNLEIISAERLAMGGHAALALNDPLTQIAIKKMLASRKEKGLAPEVIIFDNFSSLIGPGVDENSNTDMAVVMKFLVELRHHGYSVIFVHHTGKDKTTQRGASIKEDAINSTVFLEEVKGYRGEGAEFKMSFGKFRGKKPKVREQILTLMEDADGRLGFTTAPVKAQKYDALCRAIYENEGCTQDDLAAIMGVDKGHVSRLVKGARGAGLIKPKGLELTGAGIMAAGGVM